MDTSKPRKMFFGKQIVLFSLLEDILTSRNSPMILEYFLNFVYKEKSLPKYIFSEMEYYTPEIQNILVGFLNMRKSLEK